MGAWWILAGLQGAQAFQRILQRFAIWRRVAGRARLACRAVGRRPRRLGGGRRTGRRGNWGRGRCRLRRRGRRWSRRGWHGRSRRHRWGRPGRRSWLLRRRWRRRRGHGWTRRRRGRRRDHGRCRNYRCRGSRRWRQRRRGWWRRRRGWNGTQRFLRRWFLRRRLRRSGWRRRWRRGGGRCLGALDRLGCWLELYGHGRLLDGRFRRLMRQAHEERHQDRDMNRTGERATAAQGRSHRGDKRPSRGPGGG